MNSIRLQLLIHATLTLILFSIIGLFLLSKMEKPIFAQGFDCYYNACSIGPMCDLGDQYYSPGDYVFNSEINFQAAELKYIPQPYYADYFEYICPGAECNSASMPTNDLTGPAWYCTAPVVGVPAGHPPGTQVNRIQQCPDFASPCSLSDCCTGGFGCQGGQYCDDDWYLTEPTVTRFCNQPYRYGWHQCIGGSWVPGGSSSTGSCRSDPFAPWMECVWDSSQSGGQPNDPYNGNWFPSPFDFEQGACEDLYEEIKVAMTPGYIHTYTPYLYEIWNNTVNNTQSIFTMFRTALSEPTFDWPGESRLSYRFTDDYAEAGSPLDINPGSDARTYFRYLGYIHCAKENLLESISSRIPGSQPYIYYDERCNQQIWVRKGL